MTGDPISLGMLHDGSIIGIQSSDGQDVMLTIRCDDSDAYELVFHSVRSFKCDNYREGNIILDVEEVGAEELARDLRWLFAHTGEPPSEVRSDVLVGETKAKILSGKLKLVRINPSYGAEAMCLCRDYSVRKVTPDIG